MCGFNIDFGIFGNPAFEKFFQSDLISAHKQAVFYFGFKLLYKFLYSFFTLFKGQARLIHPQLRRCGSGGCIHTIPNSMGGFQLLLEKIHSCVSLQDSIKVGLEATGHYSYNILGFLLDNGLSTYVLNPLRTNLYRKSLSFRKTKTDRVDARTIAEMLLSDTGLKPYTDTSYHNKELKH